MVMLAAGGADQDRTVVIVNIFYNGKPKGAVDMRKVILYIAMSVDGYIADRGGGVGWLDEYGGGEDGSYAAFIQSVDTVVMGGKTYRQVVGELAPGVWPYDGLTSYVLTRTPCAAGEGIHFTSENPCDLIRRIRAEEGKSIWICGGAQVVRQLTQADLIDQYHISLIPVLLGSGLRLFDRTGRQIPLKLIKAKNDGEITELIYNRQRDRDG